MTGFVYTMWLRLAASVLILQFEFIGLPTDRSQHAALREKGNKNIGLEILDKLDKHFPEI